MNRTGDWICTYSGVKWFITDPHPEDVRIEDIAHALSNICRYGGHSREFYSVAQHSLIVASDVLATHQDIPLALHALLHDATEAYVGDMVRPIKLAMPAFKALENITERIIAMAFDLPWLSLEMRAVIKHFDDVALMTERRDLVNHNGIPWSQRAEPRTTRIVPFSPAVCERSFLLAFEALRSGSKDAALQFFAYW